MSVAVTPIFASLTAFLYLFLSARVINARQSERVSLGDRGNDLVLRRMRAHSNCAEYAPFALLLMLMLELVGGPVWLLVVLGLALLTGRCLHAYGFSREPEVSSLRVAGMILTFATIGVSALSGLVVTVTNVFSG